MKDEVLNNYSRAYSLSTRYNQTADIQHSKEAHKLPVDDIGGQDKLNPRIEVRVIEIIEEKENPKQGHLL